MGSGPRIRALCSPCEHCCCDAVLLVSCCMKTVKGQISIYYILQKTDGMIQLMVGFFMYGGFGIKPKLADHFIFCSPNLFCHYREKNVCFLNIPCGRWRNSMPTAFLPQEVFSPLVICRFYFWQLC